MRSRRELPAALLACIEKIRKPSREKTEDDEPSVAEQVKALHAASEAVIKRWSHRNPAAAVQRLDQMLNRRHNRVLRTLLRDAIAMRGVDPEGAIYPVEDVTELLRPCRHLFDLEQGRGEAEPCFHLECLRDATSRLLKSPDLK